MGAVVRRRCLAEPQEILNAPLLQQLVLVLRPGGLVVRPVLLRRAQHASQNAGHVFVTEGRAAGTTVPPERPGHEQMEVGRQLKARAEPLPEAARPFLRPHLADAFGIVFSSRVLFSAYRLYL